MPKRPKRFNEAEVERIAALDARLDALSAEVGMLCRELEEKVRSLLGHEPQAQAICEKIGAVGRRVTSTP
jgi:hypothetical protein